jgi:hypothetical protein
MFVLFLGMWWVAPLAWSVFSPSQVSPNRSTEPRRAPLHNASPTTALLALNSEATLGTMGFLTIFWSTQWDRLSVVEVQLWVDQLQQKKSFEIS